LITHKKKGPEGPLFIEKLFSRRKLFCAWGSRRQTIIWSCWIETLAWIVRIETLAWLIRIESLAWIVRIESLIGLLVWEYWKLSRIHRGSRRIIDRLRRYSIWEHWKLSRISTTRKIDRL
jgi:hypothetical protein